MPEHANNPKPNFPAARTSALKLGGLYALIAGIWIIGSDILTEALFRDHQITIVQTWKGWFFVGFTAVLLGLFAYRQLRTLTRTIEHTRELLEVKNVLTRELHHRIKNNLQVVSSLISLEKNGETNPDTLEKFDYLNRKVITMGIIHEISYSLQDMTRIPVNIFLEKLISSRILADHGIRLTPENGEAVLPVDIIVPFGMLVEELLNRHFLDPGLSGNEMELKFAARAEDGAHTLILTSSGPLFTCADRQSDTLAGLLARQIRGELRFLPDPMSCTECVLVFPENN